ncbi:MAG: aminotransferase class I/II-fold pyridoxal phosphate-dependent enzyme [Bacteroidota bacterium]
MANSLEILDESIADGLKKGLVHNYTDDTHFEANGSVTISGQTLFNFGSCSYLGLENNQLLKEGVVDAVTRYGTQFSSSRTYLSMGLYKELENSLGQIFQKPLLVSASTTLGHLAAIPVVVGENDAVVLDMQVHSSIQMTVQQLKARKVPIYVIKHNCMESLERKIQDLSGKHDKVWYFADGVYSMYGDFAPFGELERLLKQYKKFHLYIDDAHGMSWTGKHGCGVVRQHMGHPDKMVLAVSLNKAFASAGGCIVFPNEEMWSTVRNCGATYIFCGPIQPPMLGAACASAKYHLSEEFHEEQAHCQYLVDYTNRRLAELQLPQFQVTDSPLFFIPVGLPKITKAILKKLKEDGFYLNAASFPAVPMKKSGIRFMVNNRLGTAEIEAMLLRLQRHYINTLVEMGSSCSEVAQSFQIPQFHLEPDVAQREAEATELQVSMYRSITELCPKEWDGTYGGEGNLGYENLRLLEQTFTNQELPENNWEFYYLTVKDAQDRTVLKTFFTVALTKDDMFHSAHISEKVERERVDEPYFLTSRSVITGSLITKGHHVYLDRKHAYWKTALRLLMEQIEQVQEATEATQIMFRDFLGEQDEEFKAAMQELGLFPYALPDNFVVNGLNWNNTDEYLAGLNSKYRYNVRKEILKHEHKFIVEAEKPMDEATIRSYYDLYGQVFDQALDLNVFKLPFEYFKAMCEHPDYDVLQLYLKPEYAEGEEGIEAKPMLVGVMFSYKNAETYNALLVGLDYRYVRSHNTYKQILYQTLVRARQLDCKNLDLAYTAELEKKKLGARPEQVYAYMQVTEHDQMAVLETL